MHIRRAVLRGRVSSPTRGSPLTPSLTGAVICVSVEPLGKLAILFPTTPEPVVPCPQVRLWRCP
nr:MAG TPA: hypothetical protein [Caudoviricetes sp.]